MRRLIDIRCIGCGHEVIDIFVRDHEYPSCHKCGQPTERLWKGSSTAGVISDECDVWVKHGICNADGSPRHYRFKSEMKAEAARRGLISHVEHVPLQGSDKSPHTQRFV